MKKSEYHRDLEHILSIAEVSANTQGYDKPLTPHLLLALMSFESSILNSIFSKITPPKSELALFLEEMLNAMREVPKALPDIKYDDLMKTVEEMAVIENVKTGEFQFIMPVHLLLAILEYPDCAAVRLLKKTSVDRSEILVAYQETLYEKKNGYNKSESVKRVFQAQRNGEFPSKRQGTESYFEHEFGENITFRLDVDKEIVEGRDNEVQALVETLLQKNKRNACLVGESGVGKTSVVYGFVNYLSSGMAPLSLSSYQVFRVDITKIIMGTQFRGSFEEKFSSFLEEVNNYGDVVLLVENMESLIGSGSSMDSQIDAATMIASAIENTPDLQIIGTASYKGYRRLEKQAITLIDKFRRIVVAPNSLAETERILKQLAPIYEKYHNISISASALSSIASLSNRYISARFLPGKAIDLLDQSSVAAFLTSTVKQNGVPVLTEETVQQVVAAITGIDVCKLSQKDGERLLSLENSLEQHIIGQTVAVSALARAVRRNKAGLNDVNRPIGSFLFMGPTGVGKTELSKVLAQTLFDTPESFIRVDMSEYMEASSVSKMIGSPPGYIGHSETKTVADVILEQPYSVVLFDEIEKAHPDVLNVLLQVLDNGELTNSEGRATSFRNTVIILTSNIGSRFLLGQTQQLGFNNSNGGNEEESGLSTTAIEQAKNELKTTFSPEFLNRIDEIVVFNALSKTNILEITNNLLEALKEQIKSTQGINLIFSPNIIQKIANDGYSREYGGRPLKREIQKQLTDPLSDLIISGEVTKDSCIEFYCDAESVLRIKVNITTYA